MTKKRNHIPTLAGSRLSMALKAVDRLPLNKRAKAALQQMLVEASIPDRHDPDRAAGRQHGANIRAAEASLTALSQAHIARVNALIDSPLDDEAWLDQMEGRHE